MLGRHYNKEYFQVYVYMKLFQVLILIMAFVCVVFILIMVFTCIVLLLRELIGSWLLFSWFRDQSWFLCIQNCNSIDIFDL